MALIYRSIFAVDDAEGSFPERLPGHVEAWLRFKLRDPALSFGEDVPEGLAAYGLEASQQSGADDNCSVRRIEIFEGAREDGVEVKTTVTAIRAAGESWAWVDLERWTQDDRAVPWIPAPPGIAVTLLLNEEASRGNLALKRTAAHVSGDGGRLVADLVADRERKVPLVVVSYNEREPNGVATAGRRGAELAKKLAGVAVVYVLEDGAVTSFSKAMYDLAGEGMDVHSGAVRTYLPGALQDGDWSGRHRYVPYRKVEGRGADLAARLIAPHLLRRAVEAPPPPIWRSHARALLSGLEPDSDYEELLGLADKEISELRATIAALEDDLTIERLDNTEIQRHNDDLGRRLAYYREQVRAGSPDVAWNEPTVDEFEPVQCSEAVAQARVSLDMVEIHESVDAATANLDAHGDESWARRAWSAFQALDHYARMKREGSLDGSFSTYCESGVGDFSIPASWVAPSETKLTLENPRFRTLRTLPVVPEVNASGEILMAEHIKIERGGTPSPRIHYYDDTRGATGKIHVGWFGDHLDSRAKS